MPRLQMLVYRSPYEKKVLINIGSSTFFANFQHFRAKKVLDPILTNTFFSYGSDRCWRDKLSKCIGLHLHPPWSKHFCWSLILCLHWHRSNAYSLLQYGFGLLNRVLVELLSESPIARVYYRALFSCRLLFFLYFRTMLILSIR